MNIKRWQYLIMSLAVAVLISITFRLLIRPKDTAGDLGSVQTLQADTTVIEMGEYIGNVQLHTSYLGGLEATPTFSMPLQLGVIDLALALTRAGNFVTGTVMLDKTLVFSTEESGDLLVQGTFEGTKLVLTSQPFTIQLTPQQAVVRQFRLETDHGEGPTMAGTYRETVTGFGMEPASVLGHFQLQRPLRPEEFPTPDPADLDPTDPEPNPTPDPTDTSPEPDDPVPPADTLFLPMLGVEAQPDVHSADTPGRPTVLFLPALENELMQMEEQ
jgi:hypothetical protein